MKRKFPSIWLSLSGGGFRAAVFHYGCLKRLYELGLLNHVYGYSATSGGAFVAALLARQARLVEDDRIEDVWSAFEYTFLTLVMRGVLGPTTLLVLANLSYIISLVLFLRGGWLGLIPLATAITMHVCLVAVLAREEAHLHSENERGLARSIANIDPGRWSRISMGRFLLMLVFPSFLRWQTLNLRAFKWDPLFRLASGTLNAPPVIYITAVDLNSGREIVFSPYIVAQLDATGCRELWEQKTDREASWVEDIDLAQVVAASSAIPPWFKPVPIFNGDRLVGVLVDGGLVDNLAMNLPKALAVHIHPARPRYNKELGGMPSFQEKISLVLMLDGSALVEQKRKRQWLRLTSLTRLTDIVFAQQVEDAATTWLNLKRNLGVPTKAVTLKYGMPAGSDPDLNHYIARIRTNVDSFSVSECAVVAYCGYLWVQELIDELSAENPDVMRAYEGVKWRPLRTFSEILPDYCGSWLTSIEDLRDHLQYSNRRFRILRLMGRNYGI